jgi:hypothetical protein
MSRGECPACERSPATPGPHHMTSCHNHEFVEFEAREPERSEDSDD